ncbi:alkaline phosphatase family protein [Canibacter zhoujuaniae]|uniref:alkaline phosphatase family protein n=1 Tax=Canibacter zhoujuaniae TaxID=2708343 RepID=UPI00141F2737|nr:nucleotide pyrophosphatase/phosphodiesterase family protein [Canibacter zhoujuaniae]
MLPSGGDYGARLAALLPTISAALKAGKVSGALFVVVDGLGWANLRSRAATVSGLVPAACAQNLHDLTAKRIETVAPSTTAAALTSITTGKLPGEHGLLGYRMLDPDTRQIKTTLSDWQHVTNFRDWQRSQTVFEQLSAAGIVARVYGRKAHAHSDFTQAVLTGAEYVATATIEDRLLAALAQLRDVGGLAYVYIDELDKAGHEAGWGTELWLHRLCQLDTAIGDVLAGLSNKYGFALTADHGMVNIPKTGQRQIEELGCIPEGTLIGGEPRFRSLYLPDPEQAEHVVAELKAVEGGSLLVGTKAQWLHAGVFGAVDPENTDRIGDVLFSSRKRVAYYTENEKPEVRLMVGQHGGFDDDERGVPLLTAGAWRARFPFA